MSNQKGRRAAVVSTETPRRRGRHLVWVGLGIILIAGGIVALAMHPWKRPAAVVGRPGVSSELITQQASEIRKAVASGDSAKAIALAEKYQQQNLTPNQQVAFLEQEASAYMQKNDVDKAYQLYKQSEQLQGGKLDMATAQGLMGITYDRGDNHAAAGYARQLIAAAKATGVPIDRDDIPQYEAFIRSVGEQP